MVLELVFGLVLLVAVEEVEDGGIRGRGGEREEARDETGHEIGRGRGGRGGGGGGEEVGEEVGEDEWVALGGGPDKSLMREGRGIREREEVGDKIKVAHPCTPSETKGILRSRINHTLLDQKPNDIRVPVLTSKPEETTPQVRSLLLQGERKSVQNRKQLEERLGDLGTRWGVAGGRGSRHPRRLAQIGMTAGTRSEERDMGRKELSQPSDQRRPVAHCCTLEQQRQSRGREMDRRLDHRLDKSDGQRVVSRSDALRQVGISLLPSLLDVEGCKVLAQSDSGGRGWEIGS